MANQTPQNEEEYSYFKIQAIWGVTKHFGGLRVTEQLARMCHVDQDSYVLEVGCGTGFTACFLAEKFGCRVMGIDLSPGMVEWSQKRAVRKGLQQRCQFRVADAQQLPFEDATFDAMLCESVTAFVPDKHKALSEYRRVVKPGGYVGLNEGTWVKGSPPEDFLAFIKRAMGNADFLPPDGWHALLETSGLTQIEVKVTQMNAFQQRRDEYQGMDARDWLQRIGAVSKALGMYLTNTKFRRYANTLVPSRKVTGDLFNYLGYGLYVGKV
jgi:ubiquinone/menaquinone biosynthesis C-methylase UbiE